MNVYTYAEARQNLAMLLDKALWEAAALSRKTSYILSSPNFDARGR